MGEAQRHFRVPSRRQLRVAEIVRHDLAGHLQCFPMMNAGRQVEAMITVTAVDMSPDLRHAKVFVRCFETRSLPKDWLRQLREGKKLLRASIGRDLNLKFTPDLYFVIDESFAYADRIESIIADDYSRTTRKD